MPHLIARRSRRAWRAFPSSPRRRRSGPSWLRRSGLSWLRRSGPLRWRSERGGAALIVTVLVSGFVLTGMSALVVDVGQIYVEREELQTGADAAAVALAKSCANDASTCATQASTAVTLAGSNSSSSLAAVNAKDGKTRITQICYRTGSSGSPTCTTGGSTPETLSSRSNCIGSTPSVPYVEVHTATKTTSDATVLPPSFSRAIAGNGGYTGKEYHACARFGWGSPSTGTGLGLTISKCEWEAITHSGTTYGPVPPSTTNAKNYESKLYFHGTPDADDETSCSTATPAGWDAPGGFGWLDTPGNSNCQATPTVGGGFLTDPGANMPSECEDALQDAVDSYPKTVMMPVYDGVTGNGSHVTYHMAGFSAFVITGWFWGNGHKQDSVVSGSTLSACSGSQRCVYGYFTTGLIPGGGTNVGSGGGGYGASVIGMVG